MQPDIYKKIFHNKTFDRSKFCLIMHCDLVVPISRVVSTFKYTEKCYMYWFSTWKCGNFSQIYN